MRYKYRYLQEKISSIRPFYPTLLIVGPRQAGKSTLANKLIDEWKGGSRFAFDTPQDIARFRSDPELFFHNLSSPALLDEVQHVPELFQYVKAYVDKQPSRECQMILTGSQQFQMMQHVSESLAGRVLVKELYPFCVAEAQEKDVTAVASRLRDFLNGSLTPSHGPQVGAFPSLAVLDNILRGGYPFVQFLPDLDHCREWLRSYLQTYIQRDIRDLSHVQDLGLFHRFVQLLAGRTARIVNYSELGRDLGINYKTVQHYLSLLEASYVWKTLPPFFRNTEKRLVKSPKGIMLDTGLACVLTGIFSFESLEVSPLRGAIFETFVIAELIKLCSALSFDIQLFHFRSAGGGEVDVVIEYGGRYIPIEIKYSAATQRAWGAGVARFKDTFKKTADIGLGYVISLHPEIIFLNRETLNVPLGFFFGV
jgi:predicted AAA+ superfamily ATPase